MLLNALKLAVKPKLSGNDRDKLEKLSSEAKLGIKHDAAREAFGRTLDYFRQRARLAEIGQPAQPPLRDILLIGRYGFGRSAEFAAAELRDAIKELPSTDVIGNAPTVAFIELFSKRIRIATGAVAENLATDAKAGDSSAAIDWLVRRGKPVEIARVASLLVSNRERLPHLLPYRDLLLVALRRDKGATILQACLETAKGDKNARERLLKTIAADTKIVIGVVRSASKLLRTTHADFIGELLNVWAAAYSVLDDRSREPMSVALAGLCLTLLKKKKRSATEQHLVEAISRCLSAGLGRIMQQSDREGFWVFARASDLAQSTSESLHVTQYGAGLIASALEKAAAGMSCEALLRALASNLGMLAIGAVGETVQFDPEKHEDTTGGLLRNDAAVIKTIGWSLNGQVIRRAAVQGS
jgi:hypothetical protein